MDTSIAGILMSLAGVASPNAPFEDPMESESSVSKSAHEYANTAIEKLRMNISLVTEEEDLDVDHDLLQKDKSTCSVPELESIRRERNRMHAKKTRMRKKKVLEEMEAVRKCNKSRLDNFNS